MEHLLQASDLASYARPVSRHLDEVTAQVFITEAESLDIRPQIGDALFKELTENPETFNNRFLLNGGWYPASYTSEFGEDYDGECNAFHKGLRSALAYYTLARLIKGNDSQITRFGLVQKQTEYSDRPTQNEKNAQYRDLASVGDKYMSEALVYLQEYSANYPSAKKSERKLRNNRTKYKVIGE